MNTGLSRYNIRDLNDCQLWQQVERPINSSTVKDWSISAVEDWSMLTGLELESKINISFLNSFRKWCIKVYKSIQHWHYIWWKPDFSLLMETCRKLFYYKVLTIFPFKFFIKKKEGRLGKIVRSIGFHVAWNKRCLYGSNSHVWV